MKLRYQIMTRLADNGIRTTPVKLGEIAAKMNRLMGGGFTSRRLCHAPPPDQIAELQAHYGDGIYPTVEAGGSAAQPRIAPIRSG